MTEAVAGGVSVANANGSLFILARPSAARISNLYFSHVPSPGTNSSQTPDWPRVRIGWQRPSQRLKSPTTRTLLAFGAQTANEVPDTPS